MSNEIIYIDKVGSEDLLTSHEAEFETLGGYYFNEGRNNTINKVNNSLYDKRLTLKQEKPAETKLSCF